MAKKKKAGPIRLWNVRVEFPGLWGRRDSATHTVKADNFAEAGKRGIRGYTARARVISVSLAAEA